MSPRTFVSRGAALLALAAFGMAACESKTVVQPNPFPLQVVVSPSSLSFTAAGQKAQLSASVTGGDAGQAAQGVNWASGNTAVATVDANGNVTAVANGTTTVIATSKAVGTVSGAAAVTVAIPVVPPVTPPAKPTISIQSITDNGGNNVDVNNAAGQINVALNVDVPAGNTINSVNTLIDGAIACSQTFTGSGSAGVGVEAANAVVIVCSIPTDKLNANGTPVFANGPHTLSATLVGPGGTVQASTSQSITFNNISTLALAVTAAKTANDAVGLLWNSGNLTVTVTPSVFNAQTLSTITVQVNDPSNGLTATKTVTTTGNAPITVTFRSDSLAAAFGVKNFESAATTVSVTGGVTTAGQSFVGALGFKTIRYDAKPPQAVTQPTYAINTVGTTSWLSTSNKFTTACTLATAPNYNCQLGSVFSDAGVDVVKATFQTTASPSSSSSTWTDVTGFSSLSNTAANALVSRLNVCDNLGNCTTSTASGAFGVDLTPPFIQTETSVSGVKVAPQSIIVLAIDSLSGFDLTNGYLQVQITKDTAKSDGTDVKSCVHPTTGVTSALPSSGACAFVTIPGPAPAGAQFTIPVGQNGYFTVVTQAADVAGNVSAQTSRFFLMDATAPTISGVGVSFTTGAATAGVNGTIADNVDLAQYAGYETFAGAIAGASAIPFAAPTVVKAYGIPVIGKVTATQTVPVILGIQPTWGGAASNLSGFGFGGLDQAGNFNIGTVALTTTASAGVSTTDVVSANNTFTIDNPTPCADPTSAGCATPTKTTATPTATVVMNATTTANPLVTVYFYRLVTYGATTVAQYLTQMGTPAPAIPSSGLNQNLRVYTYTGPALAASALPSGVNTVFAVGVDKNGNGVVLGTASFTVQP